MQSIKVDQQSMTTRIVQFLLFALLLHSCVDRISIPEEKSGSLVLNCEAVVGSDQVIATLSTSNNLNGTEPIIAPEDADIRIFGGTTVDAGYRLKYFPDEGLYKTDVNIQGLWTGVANHRIIASLPTDQYDPVESKVSKPAVNSALSLSGGDVVEAVVDGDIYQGRDLTITLAEPAVKPAYYLVSVKEKLTTSTVNLDGEIEYNVTDEKIPMEIADVISGGAGAINLVHRDGLLLDQSRLTDNTFTISVNATTPKQTDDQVLVTFLVEVLAVSKDFYDYHKAKTNTIAGSDGTLNEPPIWASNIEGGFGLFSTVSYSVQEFQAY